MIRQLRHPPSSASQLLLAKHTVMIVYAPLQMSHVINHDVSSGWNDSLGRVLAVLFPSISSLCHPPTHYISMTVLYIGRRVVDYFVHTWKKYYNKVIAPTIIKRVTIKNLSHRRVKASSSRINVPLSALKISHNRYTNTNNILEMTVVTCSIVCDRASSGVLFNSHNNSTLVHKL